MGFDRILGQPYAKRLLASALQSGRLASSWLFYGPDSCGKKTTALVLAQALHCPQGGGKEGCGECGVCKRIQKGSHPDVLSFRPAGSTFKVEQAQAILREASLRPYEAAGRFFILDKVELLNEASGNALLKVLEEPQAGQRFVLVTTQPAKVLATIASRCQSLRFSPLPEKDLVSLLVREQGSTPAEARRLARLAGGSLARAGHLFKADGQARLDQAEGLLEAAASESRLAKLSWAHAAAVDKDDLKEILDLAGVCIREHMIRRLELPAGLRLLDEAPRHGRGLSLPRLESLLAGIAKVQEALRNNASAGLALELLALS